MAFRREVVFALSLAFTVVGCSGDDDDDSTVTALASGPQDGLSVEVVQQLEDTPAPSPSPAPIYTDSLTTVVAYAEASPRVVPIAWADTQADPATDYMLVTVQIEEPFIQDITQVEMSIDVGVDDGVDEGWCQPMTSVGGGLFQLRVQPSCTEPSYRDPLTNACVLATSDCDPHNGPCSREDLLTFSLWSDITTDCHGSSNGE
jgi:hypothetical protein